MRKRYQFVLVFTVPILLAAAVVAVAAFGAAAGFMWLFVAGDNPWPAYTDAILMAVLVGVFAAASIAMGLVAYRAGKAREGEPSASLGFTVMAFGATAALLLAIVGYQWRVGNIGPKSDSVTCSEFCAAKGFLGSSMPPRESGERTCSCIDAQGREAVKILMERLDGLSRGRTEE